MTISMALFLAGYAIRRRSLKWHRLLMTAGVLGTLLGAVALILAVYMLHSGDREAAGFVAVYPAWVTTTHRIIAAVAFVLMFVMLWSGATRRRRLHVSTHYVFLPLYIIVYLSGLLIFTNRQE